MFNSDFRDFIELLEKHKVSYLVEGGFAVGFHGYPRFTGDLHIWLLPDQENAKRILSAVREFGFNFTNLTEQDFSVPGNVIQIGNPPLRIDLLTEIDGVEFEEAFSQRREAIINGQKTNFIGYNDLIKNKRATGRLKDLGDIENLKS
jgi:phage replication-related protein YjqB (UPF0714/DUF867 family)